MKNSAVRLSNTIGFEKGGVEDHFVMPGGDIMSFELRRLLRRRKHTRRDMRGLRLLSEVLEIRTLLAGGIQLLDVDAGISLSEAESQQQQSFRVVLTQAPATTVVYDLATNLGDELSLSSTSVTFSSGNWNVPQSIDVTAIDDLFLEGTETGLLNVAVNESLSDSAFHADPPQNIAVTIHDHENSIVLNGTSGSDTFVFDASQSGHFRVTLNGDAKDFTADNLVVSVNTLSGTDEATLLGSLEADTVTMSPGSAILYGIDYKVIVVNAEAITTDSGGGASDLAVIYDSFGDDQFFGSATESSLSTGTRTIRAANFDLVVARSRNGTDHAEFVDSAQVDTFVGKPDYGYLGGAGYLVLTEDFASTEVFSNNSTTNVAGLYDSSGDDIFNAADDVTTFTGPGFSHTLHAFRSVRAYSLSGTDSAILNDTAGDDYFISAATYAYLQADDFYAFANGFSSIESTSTSGTDHAQFYGKEQDYYDPEFYSASRFRMGELLHTASNFESYSGYGFEIPYTNFPEWDRGLVDIGREYLQSGESSLPNDYRFDFVRELLDYRESSEAAALAATIQTQLPAYLASHPDRELWELTGYHDLIAPTGSLELVESDYGIGIDRLEFTDRFGLNSRVLHLVPNGTPKARIILMHGSYSLPEYLTGQLTLDTDEYHRNAALKWVAAGYEVFVPEMQGTTFEHLNELGYTAIGVESARMIDLLETVKPLAASPVVFAGLSRGATIAESATALSDTVDALVTSGGMIRHAPNANQVIGTASFLDFLTHKNVIVTLGNMDTMHDWSFPDVIELVHSKTANFTSDGGQLLSRFFVGVHEFWTEGEITGLEEMLSL